MHACIKSVYHMKEYFHKHMVHACIKSLYHMKLYFLSRPAFWSFFLHRKEKVLLTYDIWDMFSPRFSKLSQYSSSILYIFLPCSTATKNSRTWSTLSAHLSSLLTWIIHDLAIYQKFMDYIVCLWLTPCFRVQFRDIIRSYGHACALHSASEV